MFWICPFDEHQRNEYISKFVKTVQGLKKYHIDFESFEKVEVYEEYFAKYSELQHLTKSPFSLRIVMNILPQLIQKIEEDRQKRSSQVNMLSLSRQDIFKVFINYYYNNEIKRLAYDQDYKPLLSDVFGVEELKDFYDERYINDITQFMNIVNYIQSWDMLKHQSIIFSEVNILELFRSNIQQFGQWFDDAGGISEEQLSQLFQLFLKFTPIEGSMQSGFSYIHKSIYEFYVEQSFMNEVLDSGGEAVDKERSNIGTAYLQNDLDILRTIGREV